MIAKNHPKSPQTRFFKHIFLTFLLFFILLSSDVCFSKNIGILSGTFDPLHRGHLLIVEDAIKNLSLDTFYLLPNFSPKQKKEATPFIHRYAMTKLHSLRNSYIRLPEPEVFPKAYQKNPENVVEVLIRFIQEKEGVKENRFFHFCGTDSLNKMVKYKKLPMLKDNRVVAAIHRAGYELEFSPDLNKAIEEGRVILLDWNHPPRSSTEIRNSLKLRQPVKDDLLSEPVLHYIYRNSLYDTVLPPLEISTIFTEPVKDYTVQAFDFASSGTGDLCFNNVSLASVVSDSVLLEPLTLDFDRYLNSKLPVPVSRFLLNYQPRVTIIMGSMQTSSLFFRQKGYQKLPGLVPDRYRAGRYYFFDLIRKTPHLFITNEFSRDRNSHLIKQIANLYSRNLIDTNLIEIITSDRVEEEQRELCEESMSQLTNDDNSIVFVGYQGVLDFIISELIQFTNDFGAQALIRSKFGLRYQLKNNAGLKRLNKKACGNKYFPWWEYSLPTPNGGFKRVIALRNLYGDQTGIALETLIKKGFRDFIFFGNAGVLSSKLKLNHVYAPTLARNRSSLLFLPNKAVRNFQPCHVEKVESILDETFEWLNKTKSDVVDIETWDAIRVFSKYPEVSVYSGLVTTDRPGVQDITKKDENAVEILAAKRGFFFDAIFGFVFAKKAGKKPKFLTESYELQQR